MTSVRNSYIVLSSFPAFASSPHSPLKLSPLADYQTASISLLHVIFFLLESCLSMREQRMKTAPLSPATLRCISQPGNVQTAVFPTSLLRLPGSPTHPSVPPPHLTRALQSLSTLKLSIPLSAPTNSIT